MVSLAALLAAAAGASEPIVPTADTGSDCVAAKIYVDKTPANRRYDAQYCSVNEDKAAFDACMRNSAAQPSVAFFTDRCNSDAAGAYLSFNGRTHHVWRTGPAPKSPVSYAGEFRGEELVVRIVPVKELSRVFDADAGREFVSWSVDVHIDYRGRKATIRGEYDDSW